MSCRRVLASLLILLLPCAAARADTIGYVNMQQVIEKSKLGSRVQEQLRKDFEPKARPFAEEEKAIKQAQAALARDAALMSKDQLEKKQAELKKRIEAFEKNAVPVQKELLKAQQERSREVLIPAQKAVEKVAREKKLTLVVERSLEGLLYLDKSADITDAIIKEMDESNK
jgi:outer membrane protein